MKITEKIVNNLVQNGKKLLETRTLVLVYNVIGFTKKIDDNQQNSDFFSNKEIGEILDVIVKAEIKIKIYYNERDFIQDISNNLIDPHKNIVWNLSRQGSQNNEKSLVTSCCDYYKIPFIGSSVYSMILCRNKNHSQQLLKAYDLCHIPTYNYLNDLDNIDPGDYIVKPLNGSASRNVEILEQATSSKLKEKLSQPIQLAQKNIDGYEIEVPLLEYDNEFYALGIQGLKINNECYLKKTILNEEDSNNYNYSFYDFEDIATFHGYSTNKIISDAIKIAKIFQLHGYCRIDFRYNNTRSYYCFDIATTPYITELTSPVIAFSKFGTRSDLIFAIVGTVKPNIDSR